MDPTKPKKIEGSQVDLPEIGSVVFHHSTGYPKVVSVRPILEFNHDEPDKCILRFRNGVTGHESYYLRSLVDSKQQNDRRSEDIAICAGTTGRWDRQIIPFKQLDPILDLAQDWCVMNVDWVPF